MSTMSLWKNPHALKFQQMWFKLVSMLIIPIWSSILLFTWGIYRLAAEGKAMGVRMDESHSAFMCPE